MSILLQQGSGNSRVPRVYLAGPEVFLSDPVEIGERKKRLCAQFGLEGVFPMDAQADLTGLSPREAALRIGHMNEGLVRTCVAVVANITPFRGPSADVGTAYEMGFAAGLGKVVCAYTNVSIPFTARTLTFLGNNATKAGDGQLRDADGMAIEDWGMVDNLMLESCIVGARGCLVVTEVSVAETFTCLDGFETCLHEMTSRKLLSHARVDITC